MADKKTVRKVSSDYAKTPEQKELALEMLRQLWGGVGNMAQGNHAAMMTGVPGAYTYTPPQDWISWMQGPLAAGNAAMGFGQQAAQGMQPYMEQAGALGGQAAGALQGYGNQAVQAAQPYADQGMEMMRRRRRGLLDYFGR